VPRHPNLKSEPALNSNSGQNSSPKPKPVDTQNLTDNPNPDLFFYKQVLATRIIGQGVRSLCPLALRHAGRGQPLALYRPPYGASYVRCLPSAGLRTGAGRAEREPAAWWGGPGGANASRWQGGTGQAVPWRAGGAVGQVHPRQPASGRGRGARTSRAACRRQAGAGRVTRGRLRRHDRPRSR